MSKNKQLRKKKPWYRLRNVILAIVFAMVTFLSWTFLEVWKVYSADPNPAIDYRAKQRELAEQFIHISPEAADEGWNLLLDAVELNNKVQMHVQANVIETGFIPRSEWDEGEVDFSIVHQGIKISEDIARELTCLKLMREQGVMKAVAAFVENAPGLRQPRGEGPMLNDLMIDFSGTRDLASAIAAHMRIAAIQGDFTQSIIDFKQVLTIAHTSWHQPSLLESLVGMAIWSRATEELRFELVEYQFDEPSCERLLMILDSFELPPATLMIESEKLFIQDSMQWGFTDDADNNGYLIATGNLGFTDIGSENRSFIEALGNRFYFADRKATANMLDDFIQTVLNFASKLPIDRHSSGNLYQSYESLESKSRYRFLTILLPAFDRVINKFSVSQLQTRGTLLTIAIELYEARHGKLPDKLDDLVPYILAELPIDPITGGSILYRRLDKDPKTRKYLLYSTGMDKQDNGGDFNLKDSFEAMNNPSSNTDFLINQLRSSLDEY